jgi:hypothetical protein
MKLPRHTQETTVCPAHNDTNLCIEPTMTQTFALVAVQRHTTFCKFGQMLNTSKCYQQPDAMHRSQQGAADGEHFKHIYS